MIYPKYSITSHAKLRLSERTSLTNKQLLQILNSNSYVLYQSLSSWEEHLMFFSPLDDSWYIAAVNPLKYKVVTITSLSRSASSKKGLAVREKARSLVNLAVVLGKLI